MHIFGLNCQKFPMVRYLMLETSADWNLPPEGDQKALITPFWSICLLCFLHSLNQAALRLFH